MATPYELTSLRNLIMANSPIPLTYLGCEDAPKDMTIVVPMTRCVAIPEDPGSCIIANLIDKLRKQVFPKELGVPMHEGVSITKDRAYMAFMQEDQKSFKVLKFNHDGRWAVAALDSRDPVRIEKMWEEIAKGDKYVTLKRFRESQTTEGRKKADEERQKAGATGGEKKKVPTRGSRTEKPIRVPNARRRTVAEKAAEVAELSAVTN